MSQARLGGAMYQWSSQLAHIQWQKWLPRLPHWLTVLLIVLLAKALADLTWLLVAPSAPAPGPSQSITAPEVTQKEETPRLSKLAQYHLFGVAQTAPVAKEAPIDAKETGLRLTLRGTVAAGENRAAMAIIAGGDRGEEQVYLRGEEITAGAKLYAVYPDRVILERNGNFETLSLPREELPEGSVESHEVAEEPAVASARRVTANEQLRQLREDLVSDPQKVWQQVRIEPVLAEEGGVKGYRVNHNDPRVMQALGLSPEDVVVSINGLSLDDPTVLYGLLEELNSQQDLRLSVERDGKRRELIVDM